MNNRVKQPAYIVLLVAVMLTVLSFIPTSFTIFGFTTKPVGMLTDLTAEKKHAVVEETKEQLMAKKPAPAGFKDLDSLSFKKGFWPIAEYCVAVKDNLGILYNAIKMSKSKKVHLAFFGDSMIEGDIVTQDIRDMLQRKFGGRGVGFVPIKNNVPGFRQSIQQSFADNWTTFTVIENRKASIPYGLSGEAFMPHITIDKDGKDLGKASWSNYAGGKNYAGVDSFHSTRLYYSNPKKAKASVVVKKDDGKIIAIALENGPGLKILDLNKGAGAIHSLSITFQTNDTLFVYGVNFEDSTGVYVDDLDMRGSSGMQLSVLDDGMMKSFQQDMNIRGVVLQYGINVVHTGADKYSYYTKGFGNTIESLKNKLPQCAIIVNSVSDRAIRKHGAYETMPEIHDFVDIQKGIAQDNKVAFWNLFQAMGADSSMINMVNSDLPLANKDYTHFKPMGGNWIAGYFYYSMLYDYEKYTWELKSKENNEHS